MKENSILKNFNQIEAKKLSKEFKRSYTNLYEKNDDEKFSSNSGSLSDIDDINIDFSKLNSLKLYMERNIPYISCHFTEAEIVAEEIMNKIKKEATFLFIENYVISKLPPHCTFLSLELIDLLVNMSENDNCILEAETAKATQFTEDEEPETSKPDNWVRGKMLNQRKDDKRNEMLNLSENERINVTGYENQRNLISRVNEKALHYLNDIKEKHPPQPIDLNEKIKNSEIEDDLRNKKESEQRIIFEKKEKERIKDSEIKHQQNELAKMAKEQKAKNFTYDYDGKVILVHGPKNEKFPPATYLINFNFTQEYPPVLTEEDKKKLKKKKAQELLKEARNIQKHKKTPEDEKEFVKNIVTITPPIYDQFTLSPGVTLSMNGKLKVEPRPITATLANITDPTIRMTKTDYFNLTRTGNLSRDGISKTLDANSKLQMTQKLGKINEESSYQSGQSKDLLEKKNKKPKKIEQIGNIKINSPIMVENITNRITEKEEMELIRLQQEDYRRRMEEMNVKKEKSLLTSPIDKFNLEIISSKDWGRSTFGSNFSTNVQKTNQTKPSEKVLTQSLGVMAKKPRERYLKNTDENNSRKRLPPPMIGKTIGHGFANTIKNESFKLPENI